MVTVRYFAGARAAAGVAAEQVPADTLTDLLATLEGQHGPGLSKVLGACSFLVDGLAAHDRTVALRPGATVDVLPPFAGG